MNAVQPAVASQRDTVLCPPGCRCVACVRDFAFAVLLKSEGFDFSRLAVVAGPRTQPSAFSAELHWPPSRATRELLRCVLSANLGLPPIACSVAMLEVYCSCLHDMGAIQSRLCVLLAVRAVYHYVVQIVCSDSVATLPPRLQTLRIYSQCLSGSGHMQGSASS